MDALRAVGALRALVSDAVQIEVDDGQLMLFVRRDMLHLDADALHDRLAHWSAGELSRAMPRATASLSFRHASPAAPHDEATLDLQEAWLGLEPTLSIELGGAREGDLEAFAALVPRFLALVEGGGRPAGYRSPDLGSIE